VSTLYGQKVAWVKGQGVRARWHSVAGEDGDFTLTACKRRILESEQLGDTHTGEDGLPLDDDVCPRCRRVWSARARTTVTE